MLAAADLSTVMRFGIDAEGGENPRMHIVEPDQHAQFDELPLVEMGP
jgi:hypothetical protein